jgi:hypothetical protein
MKRFLCSLVALGNDSGQIVGVYSDASGTHGFLATPVP